jgi:hypothetical protein
MWNCSGARTHKQPSRSASPTGSSHYNTETDIETHWEHIMELWLDTCEEVLGKRKYQHQEWISSDSTKKMEKRKKKKGILNIIQTRAAKVKAQE